jgi:hypothetical protein
MENAASEATITLSTLLGTAGISAVVVGIFGLITLLLNRHWSKKDEKNGWRKTMQDSITDIKGELKAHIEADDERYAVMCRTRILRFADELINEPDHLHTQGNFEQCLQDITAYDQYCAEHPKFKNELTLRSAEIIRKIYDKCAREHKFL